MNSDTGALKLSPRERLALRDIFTRLIKGNGDLKTLVSRCNRELGDIPEADAFNDRLLVLVETSEKEGWTIELLRESMVMRPRALELQEFANKFGMGMSGTSADSRHSATPAVDHFERIVDGSKKFIDLTIWSRGLAEIEGQVCRVEHRGNALGTGFLVADDLLLTNYHVVDRYCVDSSDALDLSGLQFRFDYYKDRDSVTVNEGELFYPVADWLVDHSPYSKADLQLNPTGEAGPDELDYALIRLKPGDDGLSAAKTSSSGFDQKRGFIFIKEPAVSLKNGDSVVIMQHCDGEPLKMAFESNGISQLLTRRIRYRANTMGGSSGSPVFNGELYPIAIHHSGDPNYKKLAAFNQGVPLTLIADRVKATVGETILSRI